VGDIAPIIAESPWVPGAADETFNLGADTAYTVSALAQHVADAMGVPGHPVEHVEARNEVVVAYSDHSKAHRVFGGRPETSLADGLARMAQWARATGVQAATPFSGIEVERNLPPSWRSLVASRKS
jgi:UDP-glucose 4-epimerase